MQFKLKITNNKINETKTVRQYDIISEIISV